MNQITTGKFIAKKRKEQNLTQEQLAERLGVSNKTISKWETGKCMPDYAVVKSLCEELKVSVSELMDGTVSHFRRFRRKRFIFRASAGAVCRGNAIGYLCDRQRRKRQIVFSYVIVYAASLPLYFTAEQDILCRKMASGGKES